MEKINIDEETGIHYGVIDANLVTKWYKKCDTDFGEPCCPKCGKEVKYIDDIPEDCGYFCSDWEDNRNDYCCLRCKSTFEEDDVFPDRADFYFYDDGKLRACHPHDNTTISVSRSPYYTWMPPQVLGGEKAYCFGHEWFDWEAPYPVYTVENDLRIQPGE